MADAAAGRARPPARLHPDPRRRARRAAAPGARPVGRGRARGGAGGPRRARTRGPRSRPGEWTVAQVVDHVAQSTVRAAEELRHLRAGRRPPGPPVYEALLSGAAHRVPWTELVEGLREASAALDATLAGPERPGPGDPGAVTAPAVLVVSAPEAGSRARHLRGRAHVAGVRAGPAAPLPGPPGADPRPPRRPRGLRLTGAQRTTTSPRIDGCRAQKYGYAPGVGEARAAARPLAGEADVEPPVRAPGQPRGHRVGDVVLVRPGDARAGAHRQGPGLELEHADRGARHGSALRERGRGDSERQPEGHARSDPPSRSHPALLSRRIRRPLVLRSPPLYEPARVGGFSASPRPSSGPGTAFQSLRPRRAL